MRRSCLLFAILPFIHCSCPEGFDLIRDGECRGLYMKETVGHDTATDEAITRCKEIQGLPVIIHNEEHNTYWANRTDPAIDAFPIGLVCNDKTKQWEWVDRSPLDYKPSVYPKDLDAACKTSGCGWFGYQTGEWKIWCHTAVWEKEIFCTTQLEPPVASGDGCDMFDDDSDDGVCYQVGAESETWQEAQMNCKKLGANLASIHNQQENSFIRRLAVSKGAVNGVFLGASLSGKGNDFGWVDGSEWDYENFHHDFPMAGFGSCLAMDTSNSAGLWMNMDCSAKLPVACIREQKKVVKPTCKSGPFEEGSIITSPGFPYNASMFCDFFLSVDEGKKVEVEILFLEANSCCDSLILYDGYLGGNVIANLTGELSNTTFTTSTSNIMRVNWQPKGGVNVMGMAMTYRGV